MSSFEYYVEDSKDAKQAPNEASMLRYPFREMNMGWWDEYIHNIPSTDRVTALVRVMDCLMAHAILHEDPFLEEVVLHMNKKLPKAWPRTMSHDLINSFEVAHHIFKTICVTAKFPTLEPSAKKGLLTMTEQRIQDIDKAAQQPAIKIGRNVSPAAKVALEHIKQLRGDLESRGLYIDTMDALKTLFFTVSLHNGVVPMFGVGANPFDTFVCCDGCPCYAKLRAGHTIYLRDMEKAKIIDCLIIAAVKEGDTLMHDMASELLTNHYKDFMENPYLDDIGRIMHNGKLFYCRTALFDALNLLHYLRQPYGDTTPIQKDNISTMNRFSISLLWVKNELKDIRDLNQVVPLLDRALATAEETYAQMPSGDYRQNLHTLKDYVTAVFIALSVSEYHLAVHSRDVFVGKSADMKCANPACPATTKDLLKCSGCDVTYYCSAECQKADWEKHKNFCHEIESRRSKPVPVPCEIGQPCCIMPVA